MLGGCYVRERIDGLMQTAGKMEKVKSEELLCGIWKQDLFVLQGMVL